jgi:hypothetical protein
MIFLQGSLTVGVDYSISQGRAGGDFIDRRPI